MESNVKDVFLDSNLAIRLAFIDNLAQRGATDEQIINGFVNTNMRNSMQGNEQAANNLVSLYHDVKNRKVRVCLLPKVFKEIWRPRDHADEINFYSNYCTLVMPNNRTSFIDKTAKLANRMKDPNNFSFEKRDHNHQKFGLCDEPMIKDNGDVVEHSDFSDRLLLAQLGVLSSMAGQVSYIRCNGLSPSATYSVGAINATPEYAEGLGAMGNGEIGNVSINEKPLLFYHFNALDMGSRANEGFGHNNPLVNADKKRLENNIETTINNVGGNIKIQQIAEMERE